jgi:plasmid stabilization system protein ParE
LHRFNYVVFYRDHGPDVVIHAVLHASRSRKAWRERLREPD